MAVEAKYYAGGAAAQCRCHLAGDLHPRALLAAQLAGLHLWHLDALVVGLRLRPKVVWPGRWRRDQGRNLHRQDRCRRHALPAPGFRPGRRARSRCSVMAQATVMDVNRQAWTGTTTLLVHPASLYVGLRSEQLFRRARHAAQDRFHRHRPGRQARRRPPGGSAPPRAWNGNTAAGPGRKRKSIAQTCSSRLRKTSRSPAPSRPRSAAPTASPPPSPTSRAARTRASSPAGSAAASCPPARKVEQEEGHPDPRQRNLPARRCGPASWSSRPSARPKAC